MRRGSVSTHADDARRLCKDQRLSAGPWAPRDPATGMATHEYHRNNSVGGISSASNRHEFHMNDVIYERPGGCFVTYRKIAFGFVFVLAVLIAAGFLAVHFSSLPEEKTVTPEQVLSSEQYLPDKYELRQGIKPERYRLELEPLELINGRTRLKGRMAIEFSNTIASGDIGSEQAKRLVLNSKHLRIQNVKLVSVDLHLNSDDDDDDDHGARRLRRDVEAEISKVPANATMDDQSHIDSRFRQRVADEPSPEDVFRIIGNTTDETTGIYMLELASALTNGTYSLQIEYETTVDHRALFARNLTHESNERLILVSKLKPANAPRLFPTLDEVHLKASFVLRIVHSSDTKALSNAPPANSSSPSENTMLDEFAQTPDISPHNLAFVVGDFEQLSELSVNNQSIVLWGAAEHMGQEFYLHQKIAKVVQAWESLFVGVPKLIEKLDIVALPVNYDGASAPGLIVVRDSLFFTPTQAATATKADALLNLIGLIGQQWLGASVDARNWTDAWYVEGSELYLQHALLEKIDEELEVSDSFLVNVQLESMENDGYNLSKALDSSVDRHRIEAFDLPDIYGKGACLISMLHSAVRRSAFKQAYSDFLRRWQHSSADSDVFLNAMTLHKQIDDTKMVEAFRSWARQPGYPMISVAWNRENGSVTIRQAKFIFDQLSVAEKELAMGEKEGQALWWVPLTYVTDAQHWREPKTLWLKAEGEGRLDNVRRADGADWILFNVNKTGYYRVNYDAPTWRALTEALRANHAAFPAATRASLIDDALSLARQGSLDYETALELLHYLGPSERQFGPWKALEKHVLQLDFALYETPAYPAFQEYMQQLISKFYDENEPKIEQGSPLTMLAVRLACTFEYQKCTSWAKSKWEDIFARNHENTIPKHARETVYCEGAQRGGQEELQYLMSKFESTRDRDEKDRLLSALGCFQTPWILQKVLNEILEEKYGEGDVRAILRSYAKNPAAALTARRFIHEHWLTMVERFKDSYWTLRAFVDASTRLLFTAHDMEEFKAFVDKYYDQMVSMGYHHWVALNEVKAESWSKRLKDVTDDIQAWFTNHTTSSDV
ncbi:thyrotropin-releasing hormone-degrading ectoenzyme-like [Phymastichus coffea]|uniref:thyrotropin-releasing hormone-degrading ectoenzyme-like n=1 Tax=Phymastichus coffea TaxID=108790 RepID=UPI00273BFF5C|nr:thyrotropin-releasing hormone-degrading ectoenzyme-like [Phymastichus coffea]